MRCTVFASLLGHIVLLMEFILLRLQKAKLRIQSESPHVATFCVQTRSFLSLKLSFSCT